MSGEDLQQAARAIDQSGAPWPPAARLEPATAAPLPDWRDTAKRLATSLSTLAERLADASLSDKSGPMLEAAQALAAELWIGLETTEIKHFGPNGGGGTARVLGARISDDRAELAHAIGRTAYELIGGLLLPGRTQGDGIVSTLRRWAGKLEDLAKPAPAPVAPEALFNAYLERMRAPAAEDDAGPVLDTKTDESQRPSAAPSAEADPTPRGRLPKEAAQVKRQKLLALLRDHRTYLRDIPGAARVVGISKSTARRWIDQEMRKYDSKGRSE